MATKNKPSRWWILMSAFNLSANGFCLNGHAWPLALFGLLLSGIGLIGYCEDLRAEGGAQ